MAYNEFERTETQVPQTSTQARSVAINRLTALRETLSPRWLLWILGGTITTAVILATLGINILHRSAGRYIAQPVRNCLVGLVVNNPHVTQIGAPSTQYIESEIGGISPTGHIFLGAEVMPRTTYSFRLTGTDTAGKNVDCAVQSVMSPQDLTHNTETADSLVVGSALEDSLQGMGNGQVNLISAPYVGPNLFPIPVS